VEIGNSIEKRLSDIAQFTAAVSSHTECHVLKKDVLCENRNDTRRVMRIPGVTPGLSDALSVTVVGLRTCLGGTSAGKQECNACRTYGAGPR
jgi:hypothetical protein